MEVELVRKVLWKILQQKLPPMTAPNILYYYSAPPEQIYWQNRDPANIGLDRSVGRALARLLGGRWFKINSSKFFVNPKNHITILPDFVHNCAEDHI